MDSQQRFEQELAEILTEQDEAAWAEYQDLIEATERKVA